MTTFITIISAFLLCFNMVLASSNEEEYPTVLIHWHSVDAHLNHHTSLKFRGPLAPHHVQMLPYVIGLRSVTTLDLIECTLNDDAIRIIGNSPCFLNLKTLDLSHNLLGPTAAVHLMPLLLHPESSLEVLNFGYNKLGLQGASNIAFSLQKNIKIKCLSLAGNNIGTIGFTHMARTLRQNRSLLQLYLGDNPQNGDGSGIRILAEVLSTNHTLERLCLGRCGLGELLAPPDVCSTGHPLRILSHPLGMLINYLSENRGLIKLGLKGNNLSNSSFSVVKEFAGLLARTSGPLSSIDLRENGFSVDSIPKGIPKDRSLLIHDMDPAPSAEMGIKLIATALEQILQEPAVESAPPSKESNEVTAPLKTEEIPQEREAEESTRKRKRPKKYE